MGNKPDRSDEFEALAQALTDLTARVQQLERRLDAALAARPPAPSPRPVGRVVPIATPTAKESHLESRIGSQWLNRVGVVAVLFGVAYLLRYVFVSGWVSAEAWIWAGVCAGVLVVVASEWFRRNGYRVLSLSLKATGIGVSYLSLWAGMELYRMFSGAGTFVGLLLLTALAVVLAIREQSQVVGALALVTGFLTPLLISVPSREGPLFLYLVLLDCAAAALAIRRPWWKLLWLSAGFTAVLSAVWYYRQYALADLLGCVLAATVLFGIFSAATAATRRMFAARTPPMLLALEVLQAAFYFTALYVLLDGVYHEWLGGAAAALAAMYFARAWTAQHRTPSEDLRTSTVFLGLGIAFAAVMLASWLNSDWLSLGWFLEAAVVMAIGFWRELPRLRWGALLLLCAAVVKAFAFDVWQLSLGYRTLSFIALGILLLVISFVYQRHGFSLTTRSGGESSR